MCRPMPKVFAFSHVDFESKKPTRRSVFPARWGNFQNRPDPKISDVVDMETVKTGPPAEMRSHHHSPRSSFRLESALHSMPPAGREELAERILPDGRQKNWAAPEDLARLLLAGRHTLVAGRRQEIQIIRAARRSWTRRHFPAQPIRRKLLRVDLSLAKKLGWDDKKKVRSNPMERRILPLRANQDCPNSDPNR